MTSNENLIEMGKKYRKSAAQLILRWHLQLGSSKALFLLLLLVPLPLLPFASLFACSSLLVRSLPFLRFPRSLRFASSSLRFLSLRFLFASFPFPSIHSYSSIPYYCSLFASIACLYLIFPSLPFPTLPFPFFFSQCNSLQEPFQFQRAPLLRESKKTPTSSTLKFLVKTCSESRRCTRESDTIGIQPM